MQNETENTTVRRKKFWKFWLLMAAINIGLLFVLFRLFHVQILNADNYKDQARKQHESRITLSAQRGNIYDRNGNILASTVKSFSIAADPTVLTKKDEVCKKLEELLGISQSVFEEKISSAKGSFVWLARGISPDKVSSIRSINDRGLIIIEEPKRHYYYSTAASQLIGCTDIDNKGISGVELGWDSLLMGRSGYMMMYRDGLGRLRHSADLPTIPAINGYSIELTIDIELQRIVEFELMQGVLNTKAESGTIVAIKPSTGEILAMATYPSFDPNNPSTYRPADMRNRTITDVYEPGSTFKMITAAAAIEEKITKFEDEYNGFNGEFHFAKNVIRDVHPHGHTTFHEGMVHSSNIILSSVAAKIPDYTFYKYIRDFGFGIVSGIDLPGEIPGRIQRAEQLSMSAKRFIGFGYGLLSTPLQIVNSYAALANQGVMMKPFAVRSVFDTKGKKVMEYRPERIRRVVSENTRNIITNVLTEAVERGTGKGARIHGLSIAGKTGTSQQLVDGAYSKADYNASFVGFYPAEDPQICMLVFLDKPKTSIYGGSTAAPIFRNITLRWISITPEQIAFKPNERSSNDTVYVPNLKGLLIDDAGSILQTLGLRWTSTSAVGLVETQFPHAGEKLRRGTIVKLTTTISDTSSTLISSKKPNVTGLSARRAVAILHNEGIRTRVKGSGKVIRQIWEKNEKGEQTCILICSPN